MNKSDLVLHEVDILIDLLDDFYYKADRALQRSIEYDNRGSEQRYMGETFAYSIAKNHAEICRNRLSEVLRDDA